MSSVRGNSRHFGRRILGPFLVAGFALIPAMIGLAPRSYPAPARPAAPGHPVAVSIKPNTGRVIQVRPNRIDLTVDGVTNTTVWRAPGPLTIQALAAAIDAPSWLSVSGSTVELRAGLYQAPQTSLTFAAPAVTRVLLDQDAQGVGGTIRGTSATVVFAGVSVLGWDPVSLAPAAESADRPYIYYTHGSDVRIAAAGFASLGRPGSGGEGVTLGTATTGSIAGSKITRSYTGLSLIGTATVKVSATTVGSSLADGVLVKEATAVTLSHVTVSHNSGYGLSIERAVGASLAAVTSSNNGSGAVHLASAGNAVVTALSSSAEPVGLLVDQTSARIALVGASMTNDGVAVKTTADVAHVRLAGVTAKSFRISGMELAGTDVRVSRAALSGGPVGVAMTSISTAVQVRNTTISTVATGVRIGAGATRTMLSSLRLDDISGDGVLTAGSGVTMSGLAITSAGAGVRVYGSSDGATLSTSTIAASAVGLTLSTSVRSFSVVDTAISGVSTGVSSSARQLQVQGATIARATTGMRIAGGARIAQTTLTGVQDGLRIGARAAAWVSGMHLTAAGVGLRVAGGGELTVDSSVVAAAKLSIGHVHYGANNSLPPQKLPWYGVAAVVAAAMAILLEMLRRLREKAEDRKWLLPLGVSNTR